MELVKQEFVTPAIKITVEKDGAVVGRAYLYMLQNNLHTDPYGFIEDVFVDEHQRGQGVGNELLRGVIAEAKARGCYKLVGTSRFEREAVHVWYEKLGFKKYGVEFRMDFN